MQLNVQAGGSYIDCTFGRGGHSGAILSNLGERGTLLALDRDPSAIEYGREKFSDARLHLVHAKFSDIEEVSRKLPMIDGVDGIFADLGVSSPQLDSAERGFSFQLDGPLDMRMDPSSGISAAQWLREADEQSIIDCLREFGEERHAKRVARFIIEDRVTEPLETTSQLADLCRRAIPKANRQRIHPATRTFQALRIIVNDELREVSVFLERAINMLKVGARLVVIAFHSLEDRIVKRFFRDACREAYDAPASTRLYKLPFRKPLRPSEVEQQTNPRARSARLRVLERIA